MKLYATPSEYTKGIVSLIGSLLLLVITTLQSVYGKGNALYVTLSVLVVLFGAVGTILAKNAPTGFWSYAKGWINALALILQAVIVYVGTNGSLADITPLQMLVLAATFLTGLGVVTLPNTPNPAQIIKDHEALQDGPQHLAE